VDRRSIPNALTLARAALVLPFWIAFEQPGVAAAAAAVGIAFAIELTDLLDGWLARRLGATSDLGKLLDPAADAFSRLTIFIALATRAAPDGGPPWLPGWVPALMLFRDTGVAFVRQVAASRGRVVGARLSGKLKAWVQGIAIWILLVVHLEATWRGVVADDRRRVAEWAGAIAALFMLGTLLDYALGNRDVLVKSGASERSVDDVSGGERA
jgi:CDP-diacylglycerol--glycerol-3-phosphate 3-phosphatidyltransferase